jgi:oligopeptidase B
MKPQHRPLPEAPREPRADVRLTQATWHGVTLADEYAWLKDENWQAVIRDPSCLKSDIRAYLEAENAFADAALTDTQTLQAALLAEMRGRIKEDDSSVPTPDGPYAYFSRYREGAQHPMICREARNGGPTEVLLDGDALAQGKAYFQLGDTNHSPDHKFIAWLCDEAGSEYFTARVRNIETGTDLADIIPEATGTAVWSADGSAIYYVRLDEHHRPHYVYRHRLGTQADQDELVFENDDPQFFVSLSQTQSERFARISLHDHETSECWLVDLRDAHTRPRLVARRDKGVQYEVEHHPNLADAETLLIRTNADGAEDFKFVVAPLAAPERAHWRDLIPHRQGVYRLAFLLLADWLIRLEREDGIPRIVVRRLAGGEEHAIAFAEEAYSLGMDAGLEFETDRLRFTYASMTTPSEVWDYNLASRERVLRKRQEIPSGHDPSAYVTRRLLAPAHDGQLIPISLIHHKATPIDGTAPGLVYGYGAYGIAMPAGFGGGRLSLVDRGFVYAIAHVRGGTEKGWHWYRNGKLAHKPNTFRDFIAATEFLVANRWMAADKVVAQGGSAGGMLMGAIANQGPDLFAGVVAEVPFVDVLNTMLDDSLPLTPPEWPEWGNPRTDVEAFHLIRSYSPYDNVGAQAYPALLVLAGLTDPRVTYWEPAKWVARLRARRTNQKLLAFRTNLDAGHGGASGRFERLKEVALAYAFAIKVTDTPHSIART